MHQRLDVLAEKGFVVLDDYAGPPVPESEWMNLVYKDWKSGGDTNFAPLASANGELDCAGFWDYGKTDKDGLWTSNKPMSPTLVKWVEQVGANYGRVRVIKLNPSSEEAALKQIHLDDNNRMNPEGQGWVVRTWLELTDNPNSYMILREKKDDPTTESRISLHRNRQVVIDTERMWHVVWHAGQEPRYALITSFESGPQLNSWITAHLPQTAGAGRTTG